MSQYNVKRNFKTQKTHTNKFTFTSLRFSLNKLGKKSETKLFRSNIFSLYLSCYQKDNFSLLR